VISSDDESHYLAMVVAVLMSEHHGARIHRTENEKVNAMKALELPVLACIQSKSLNAFKVSGDLNVSNQQVVFSHLLGAFTLTAICSGKLA